MGKKNIVVLGAGYGGLKTVVDLQKLISKEDAVITLVNKNAYHYETTWLHETSAGTIDKERATYLIEDLLNKEKVKFIQDTVVKIDKDNKSVQLEKETLSYDYLVIGLGFESETFGIAGLDKYAFSITNIETATRIKEEIENKVKSLKESEELHIVVGGAGFTGIEFLGELVKRIPKLSEKYGVNSKNIHITCVEASPTVLPQFDRDLVDYAIKYLESKGIEFKIGTAIKEATENGVRISKDDKEEVIPSDVLIWSAGVKGSSIIADSGFEQKRNKISVNPYLQVPDYEDIFVVGDCAFMMDESTNRPYPPTAQIAVQHGQNCAKNLYSLVQGNNNLEPFKFSNKGTVCSLGEGNGIGNAFGVNFKGGVAGFMKKVVDNRSLYMLGGISVLKKKGKF